MTAQQCAETVTAQQCAAAVTAQQCAEVAGLLRGTELVFLSNTKLEERLWLPNEMQLLPI